MTAVDYVYSGVPRKLNGMQTILLKKLMRPKIITEILSNITVTRVLHKNQRVELARYTHRVAISNHRLVAFENDRVSFRWRDYAHGGKNKILTVSAHEFLRRFLLHVLPSGLVRSDTSDSSLIADEAQHSNAAAHFSVWQPLSICPNHPACAVQHAPASCWSSNG